jgi:uncharacterized membrane protein YkvA (DUF1232 family)
MSSDPREPLDVFASWLKALPADAIHVAEGLVAPSLESEQRVWLAGGVNYLLKSVDLIPDGVQDLGFLDDAFVLRFAVREAFAVRPFDADTLPALCQLASEAEYIGEFLGKDAARLLDYVSGLRIAKVRGRSPSDIGEDETLARDVIEEARIWAEGYVEPSFAHDEKTLVKLRSFLSTKLA